MLSYTQIIQSFNEILNWKMGLLLHFYFVLFFMLYVCQFTQLPLVKLASHTHTHTHTHILIYTQNLSIGGSCKQIFSKITNQPVILHVQVYLLQAKMTDLKMNYLFIFSFYLFFFLISAQPVRVLHLASLHAVNVRQLIFAVWCFIDFFFIAPLGAF